MSSAICFNLNQSKILLSGNGLIWGLELSHYIVLCVCAGIFNLENRRKFRSKLVRSRGSRFMKIKYKQEISFKKDRSRNTRERERERGIHLLKVNVSAHVAILKSVT